MKESAAFAEARAGLDAVASRNVSIVAEFFAALEKQDFAGASALCTEDALYRDQPSADFDAIGPEAIREKLSKGLAGLEAFVLGVTRVSATDSFVMSERVEEWHFPGGHVARLPVMCTHEIRTGRISAWREYWDLNTLVAQLPEGWLAQRAQDAS